MSLNYQIRHAIHPNDFMRYNTEEIRNSFLVDGLFVEDEINLTYTLYDRLIVGGVFPKSNEVKLESFDAIKAAYFLERREIGIINVGDTAEVIAEGVTYELNNKEALYIGRGVKEVIFKPSKNGDARFYFNSAPAHRVCATKKVSLAEAETVEMGALENSNHRFIRKALISGVIDTCQLQMGITELQTGSVWNTMPAHTHDRRMEAYFYFDLKEGEVVSHFMGQPDETRHIWMKNHEAVISPPWSIHAGAGTSNYTFIWGMAGENLDYGDMDKVAPSDLK